MPEETKAASSPAPKATEVAETETDLEASDVDPEDESADDKLPFHRHPRWKKVHGDLKAYKGLGRSAEEIQDDLSRLERFDKIVAEEEAKAKKKAAAGDEDDDPELTKRRKAARKELSKIAPEVDAIVAAADKTNLYFDSLGRRATREMTVLLKDAGMSTKEKSLEAMADVLGGIIAEDKELYDDYLSDPKGAVREAFKRFRSDSVEAAQRKAKADVQKDKTKLMGLPKVHKSGGSSEVSVVRAEGPRNLKEARIAAERRLAALEE